MIKLQLQSINNIKVEIDKLKAKVEKQKGELIQTQTELEETRDCATELTESNSKAIIKNFKRSDELQHYLLSYGVGIYDMAYKDFCKYLQAKKPSWDLKFINLIKDGFHSGEDVEQILSNERSIEQSISALSNIIPPAKLNASHDQSI